MKTQNKIRKEKPTAKLITANKNNATELSVANKGYFAQTNENRDNMEQLIGVNEEKAHELVTENKDLISQNDTKLEHVAGLIVTNEENALALAAVNKEINMKNVDERESVDELIAANEVNAIALINAANKELISQNKIKERREQKLININRELANQIEEKEKLTLELMNANKELLFQNEEKEKLTTELIIANKELLFQIEEKEKMAAEQIIANKELILQNARKEKKEIELIIANNWFLQSEENFHRSISESPLGIRIVNKKGKTVYVNKAFLDMYEFESLEEFENKPIVEWYTPESYAQHLIRKGLRKKGNEIYEYEKSMITKNGEIRHVKVWRNEVLWNGVKHYQVINLDITMQKNAEKTLKDTQLELRMFATHLQDVREEEKIGLSREIHDDLGQILVALKIDLGMFKKELSKENANISSEEILTKFDELSTLVDKTIKTTRRIMNGLRPELIELLGFIEAAKLYIHEFQERINIPCQFKCDIPELNINQQQSVALFRILQEALTNVAKHAQAKAVKIQLSLQNNKLVLEIADNGVGLDEKQKIRPDSYGMIGMKERVSLLEGDLFISGKPGKGTTVKVAMPYSVNYFSKL